MKIKTTETIKRTSFICDKCGWKSTDLEDNKFLRKFHTCSVCGGDFCEKCGDPTDGSFNRGNYEGDYYGYWVCDFCWETGKPFLDEMKKEEEEFDRISEEYWKEKGNWKNKWIEAVKEKNKNGYEKT